MNQLLLTYGRIHSQAWHLHPKMEDLNRQREIDPENYQRITTQLKATMDLYNELRAKSLKMKKPLFRMYRFYKEKIPQKLMDMYNMFFEEDEMENEELSDDEEAPEIDENNPWLPFKIPEDHLLISRVDGFVKEIYDTQMTEEFKAIYNDLANFFFYEFYERGLYKQKKFSNGKNFWRSIHTQPRHDYESKLAHICALNFLKKLAENNYEIKLTPAEIKEQRNFARRKLQNEERELIGQENMDIHYPEAFNRHMEQAEKFKEKHLYISPKKPIKITPKTSSNRVNRIPSVCREVFDDVFNQLKNQHFATSDCKSLLKLHDKVRIHSSKPRVTKMLYIKLISELQHKIDVMEKRTNS